MRVRRTEGQEGAALVVVLIFISVFGLILSALMTESTVNVKYTTIVGDHEAKVYAADAGVSFGIQQLRQNNTLCPRVGATGPPISTLTINGPHGEPRTVEVECSVNSGSTGGLDGYAIITRSPNAGSLVLSGGASKKKIAGYVYVTGGVDWGPGLAVARGDFIHQDQGSGCLNPPPESDLTLARPPYDYYCQSVAEFPPPNPVYVAPAVPVVANPAYTDVGTCRVFRPGLYTSPPTLRTGDNYFISGVYYFNLDDDDPDNNVIDVKQSTIYGGQPSPAEEPRFPLPVDCEDQDPADSKTGVEFIFGAQARMAIDTSGQAELFGRTGEPDPASSDVSFVAVPTADPGWPTGPGNWEPSSLPSGTPVLDIKEGNQQDMAIHGVIYAPTAGVKLTATNDVLAQAMSGLMVWTLELKSSESGGGLSVSVAGRKPNPRHIKITATALGEGAGERAVLSSAVVEISNDDAKTVTVESWRTRGPGDPL